MVEAVKGTDNGITRECAVEAVKDTENSITRESVR